MRHGPDDDTIMANSLEGARTGFATEPMTLAELEKHLASAKYRLIRRFVVAQATGTTRIIDDAVNGGQSEASADENIVNFCSALQSAHRLSALQKEFAREGLAWPAR